MNKEKLIELKNALETEEKINQEIKLKREQFEKDNTELFLKQIQIRETINQCKEVLIENAEVGYAKDGLKKRLGGIGVRVGSELLYDNIKALEWAKHHQLCLQLNKKEFETIAKTQNLDFVDKKEKITITFPKEIQLGE